MISVKDAKNVLKGFNGQKVLVVGDMMLDRYLSGSVSRISPEAPVPVVLVDDERCLPGGAANVALNIQSLGGQAIVAGIVGDDAAGEDLLRVLGESGISLDGIVSIKDAKTTVKTRILADRQQVVRVDHECESIITAEAICAIKEKIGHILSDVDGVILEDYGKGVVCQEVVDFLLSLAIDAGIPVGFDPKANHDLNVPGITLSTPNFAEACAMAGVAVEELSGEISASETLRAVGEELMSKWSCEFLVITLGPHGMYMLDKNSKPVVVPTKAREVFDVSGAGDTVIGTAVLALTAGADHFQAASLANYAAGLVVGKVGTATCTQSELLKVIEEPK